MFYQCFTFLQKCFTKNDLQYKETMKKPTVSVVFNRKNTATKTKSAPIELRITSERKSFYVSTGIKVCLGQFDGRRIKMRIDCLTLTETLTKTIAEITEAVERSWEDGSFSPETIKQAMDRDQKKRPDLFKWMEQRVEEHSLKESTRRQHRVAVKMMKECGIFRSWDDLTIQNIIRFDEMLKRNMASQQTVHSYHKRLRPYIKDAYIFGMIEKNPYDGFTSPVGKSERIRYLTDEERRKIENTELDNSTLEKVRDCFLFCCYTGLAYGDASTLKDENIVTMGNDTYIISERVKNRADIYIKLIDKARKIMDKYGNHLPWMSNEKYNLYLKALAAHCGIDKRLTSHMARHTFATSALHNGVPIQVVSKMMSHSSIKMTQNYAKILAEDVSKGFDHLNDID